MNIDTIIVFSVFSFFYVISPGPAIFLAIANGMSGRLKAVVLSSMGNVLGLFFLSTISNIGLGALILASATLFFIVKIFGAAYLIFLGYKQFKTSQALRGKNLLQDKNDERTHHSYFVEGFLLAATNPKAILFFIAIFPQFLNIETSLLPQFFTMTLIFMSISFASLFSYGFVAKSAKKFFSSHRGMLWFHRLTGGLFVGMGFALLQLKNIQS